MDANAGDEILEYYNYPYEATGEYGGGAEEASAKPPPNYMAADGNYSIFCTCGDWETCKFCRWFSLIKSCDVHRQATIQKFKPCRCLSKGSKAQDGKSKSLSEELSIVLPNSACQCPKGTHLIPIACDCTDKIALDSRSEESIQAKESAAQALREIISDTTVYTGGLDEETQDSVELNSRYVEYDNDELSRKEPPADCDCHGLIVSRNSSKSEIESTWSRASDVGSSSESYTDMVIGGHLFDNEVLSSDPNSSEETSTEYSPMDWTRVKWINDASDRSVESLSDDEYVADEVDRIAAEWALANIKNRRYNDTNRIQTSKAEGKESDDTRRYLLTKNRRDKSLAEICASNTDDRNVRYKLVDFDLLCG